MFESFGLPKNVTAESMFALEKLFAHSSLTSSFPFPTNQTRKSRIPFERRETQALLKSTWPLYRWKPPTMTNVNGGLSKIVLSGARKRDSSIPL